MNREEKVEQTPEQKAFYRATHGSDGHALGSSKYPNNREGRRRMARSWRGRKDE